MFKGKTEYLKQLTSRLHMKSVSLGRELDGTTPPSVFIGSWNYPKVYAGPMFTPQHGDTSILDTPEAWIPSQMTTNNIVDFRMNLVRGKREVRVTDVNNKVVEKIQEITLAKDSVESEARFKNNPVGRSFTDEHTPYGPSALLEEFDIGNARWDNSLEKVYYDWDLKAADAVATLYDREVPFSRIQKAFSVGTMGGKRARRLVPTRWSITAVDTILGDMLLDEVKHYDVIDYYRVYEFESLHNYYAIILIPTAWQYEWMEAFLHVMGGEELLFSDYETNLGKKGYSRVGGCYYSCKFGVLEALARERIQAGAIVLREAYRGYVPLGVFNVRENVRNALTTQPRQFNDFKAVLRYMTTKLQLPLSRFIRDSTILKDHMTRRQTKLTHFT